MTARPNAWPESDGGFWTVATAPGRPLGFVATASPPPHAPSVAMPIAMAAQASKRLCARPRGRRQASARHGLGSTWPATARMVDAACNRKWRTINAPRLAKTAMCSAFIEVLHCRRRRSSRLRSVRDGGNRARCGPRCDHSLHAISPICDSNSSAELQSRLTEVAECRAECRAGMQLRGPTAECTEAYSCGTAGGTSGEPESESVPFGHNFGWAASCISSRSTCMPELDSPKVCQKPIEPVVRHRHGQQVRGLACAMSPDARFG